MNYDWLIASAVGCMSDRIFRFDAFSVDMRRAELRKGDEVVHVEPLVFDLLAFLAARPGRVYSRDQLLQEVWGFDYSGDTRTVDVHVRWLRLKIEDDPSSPVRLQTVRGVGYRYSA